MLLFFIMLNIIDKNYNYCKIKFTLFMIGYIIFDDGFVILVKLFSIAVD
jgi:hypothetical protein